MNTARWRSVRTNYRYNIGSHYYYLLLRLLQEKKKVLTNFLSLLFPLTSYVSTSVSFLLVFPIIPFFLLFPCPFMFTIFLFIFLILLLLLLRPFYHFFLLIPLKPRLRPTRGPPPPVRSPLTLSEVEFTFLRAANYYFIFLTCY